LNLVVLIGANMRFNAGLSQKVAGQTVKPEEFRVR
jgi:hypothetical protein